MKIWDFLVACYDRLHANVDKLYRKSLFKSVLVDRVYEGDNDNYIFIFTWVFAGFYLKYVILGLRVFWSYNCCPRKRRRVFL